MKCEAVAQDYQVLPLHACMSMLSASFRRLGLTSHSPGCPTLTSFQDFSFLTHGRCEASFVSLCYRIRLPWRTTVLRALRGYATEPDSLKRGCFTRFSFQKLLPDDFQSVTMRPELSWTSLVVYYHDALPSRNFSSFMLRQKKKRVELVLHGTELHLLCNPGDSLRSVITH